MCRAFVMLMILCGLTGCAESRQTQERLRDEIVICGHLIHTGAPVVLWFDDKGYDAYRAENRFNTKQPKTTKRYGQRPTQPQDVMALRKVVDQFVIHYDAAGTSRQCFKVLHDIRGLSVHFMLDVDGTIYQTLDLKERAWHATIANDRSIGIEIANIGAQRYGGPPLLKSWYRRDVDGRTVMTLPGWMKQSGVRTPGFVARPIRNEPVTGIIQSAKLIQYDLTEQQYDSLVKLTAALCRQFPLIKCDYPRDAQRSLVRGKLDEKVFNRYQGILGHYHVQKNKIDPGPAFQWDRLISGARNRMRKVAIR